MAFSYQDNQKTILISAPKDAEVEIPSQVKEIYGSNNKNYAFMDAASILLRVSFLKAVNLVKISDYAFYNCDKLESVDLSSCKKLNEIGRAAFRYCTSINSITLPNGTLTTIRTEAFYECISFTDIYIPASVTTIESTTFRSCHALKHFILDPEVKIETINFYTFYGCKSLEDLYIPPSVSAFHNALDKSCVKCTRFNIDERNTHFNCIDGVAYSTDNKTLLVFPPGRTGHYKVLDGVTDIGYCSATDCHITTIEFPLTLKRVAQWGFSSSKLTKVVFPEGIDTIESSSFSSSALEYITFPETVKYIRSKAFAKCANLKKVIMPLHFQGLGGGIFNGCPESAIIDFGNSSDIKVREQRIAYSNNNKVIFLYMGNYENITIYNTVERIEHLVFNDKTELKRIIFEEGSHLQYILDGAFAGTSITELVLPDSLLEISRYAFEECNQLISVTFGTSLTHIEPIAFQKCKELKSITFKDSNCKIDESAFDTCTKLETINFANGVTEIVDFAFSSCTALKEVTLPQKLTKVGKYIFKNTGITKVTFNELSNIVEFPELLFDETYSLETVNFPKSVTKFGPNAFQSTHITTFTIPPSLETIDNYCFKNCTSLKTFSIPKGSKLRSIGFRAFIYSYAFERVTCESDDFTVINNALYTNPVEKLIVVPPNTPVKFFSFPETLKTVSQCALLHCVNIKQIFIPPKSVETIENNAFEECISLININIPICTKTIMREAFLKCNKLQCGLLVENEDKDFRKNLIEEALLPPICLKRCDKVCELERKGVPNIKKISNAAVLMILFE